MLRRVPLIVILGSTGTGKTKLSLELSERFGGEIISADSMQVYANLDIVTAKATKEEQSRAKHHMLDVAAPNETFTVVNFRNKALPIVENLLAQSKCPIVVGGTNYYIESLIWNVLVSSPDCADYLPSTSTLCAATERTTNADIDATAFRNAENLSLLQSEELILQSSELLHKHLRNIDPTTANRIHPNNKRKIMRAIEFYQQTGQLLSSMLNEQRQQPGANRLGGPLRYRHTILLWLRCNQDVLNERLDKRVDSMLEQGLLRELRGFYNNHTHNKTVSEASPTTSSKSELAYDKGVLQTIGFKEFIPYLNQFDEAEDQKIDTYLRENGYKMPSEEEFKSLENLTNGPYDEIPQGMELLSSCLNELKLVTRRYSKKQIKWINNRFLASKDRQVPDLYELDTSDVVNWHEKVYCQAEKIIDCYRNNTVCEIKPMQKTVHPAEGLNEETTNFCSTCERYFIGEYQWRLHLKSNKHKKRKEAIKRNAEKQTLNEVEYQSGETQ